MDDSPALPLVADAPGPDGSAPLAADAPAAVALAPPPRWFSALQVLVVCGIPTQLFVAGVLVFNGMRPFDGDGLSLQFFATLSLLDTALVALLIRFFLALNGETSRDVFLGRRPLGREVAIGLLLVPVVFAGVTAIVLGLRAVAPWLHNVSVSPLEAFLRTPLDSAIFGVVAVLAGGVREELQRAFILHRFGQNLGGAWVGLAVFSVMFGVLHVDQGFDVALAIGALGVFWGVLYLRRRSAVVAIVNHSGFNASQVIQHMVVRSLGV